MDSGVSLAAGGRNKERKSRDSSEIYVVHLEGF